MPPFEQLRSAEFWAALRPADLLDLALVAVALAVVLSWLKRRATRPLLVLVVLGVAVYALARSLDLYLTLWAFRVGSVALFAAILLAYQEDVRRGFEQLVTGRMFRRVRGPDDVAATVDTLVEAAFDFARQNVGALIVLRGREHLDRHLRGGTAVGGRLSLPLLQCVFDPSSPGHDGAAVVDIDGKLDRIGSHLPLSGNLAALAGRGTRHAAALGLAERSDAVVVTVSEERGTVSLARDGRLEPAATPAALSAALAGFFEAHRTRPPKAAWRPKDLETKFAALLLACLLWLDIAAPAGTAQQTEDVAVELRQVPRGWDVAVFPERVRVTLAGPEVAFRDLDWNALRLTYDLKGLKAGETLLDTDDGTLDLPDRLRVERFGEETIFLRARPPETPPR